MSVKGTLHLRSEVRNLNSKEEIKTQENMLRTTTPSTNNNNNDDDDNDDGGSDDDDDDNNYNNLGQKTRPNNN